VLEQPEYLTDGVHLYEVESVVQNGSGLIMTVRDCVTEARHELTEAEQAHCTSVTPAQEVTVDG
jgi:hypothetical protein